MKSDKDLEKDRDEKCRMQRRKNGDVLCAELDDVIQRLNLIDMIQFKTVPFDTSVFLIDDRFAVRSKLDTIGELIDSLRKEF